MDTLKQKREDLVAKEDAFLALVNKSKAGNLSEDELAQLESVGAAIEDLKADVKKLEDAESKAAQIMKRQSKPAEASAVGAVQDNYSENKEMATLAKRYSVAKAFQNVLNRKEIDGAEKEVFEIAQAEAKEHGMQLSGNIAIPQKFIQIGKRKLLDVATEGTDVVFTEYGGSVIPFLRPDPVAARMGVTILSGLRGDVQWPRNNGDVAFAWETETSNVDETTPTFDNITITPKRVGGYVDVSMQMLKQSIFVVEPFIRDILQTRYALTIDHAVFNGTGAGNNQPTGIFNYNGVNVLSLGSAGGDMTYNALLSMMRDVQNDNGRVGVQAFVTNPSGVHSLSTTPRQAGGLEGNFIYNGTGPLFGVPVYNTTTIPSNFSEGGSGSILSGIIYSSNWGGAMLGTWGGLDLLFDPYTQALGGKVRFVCNAFMDFEVQQPVEFTICKDWNTTLPALT
jgi:HK97 family phage major capsid protein